MRVERPPAQPHLGKNEPDFAARDHRHADQRLVSIEPPGCISSHELSPHRNHQQRTADHQGFGVCECSHIDRGADRSEKYRYEQQPERRRCLLDLPSLGSLVQHQPGSERTDDARRSRYVGGPCEKKRECQGDQPQSAGGTNVLDEPEQRRREKATQYVRRDHEPDGDPRNSSNTEWRDAGP